jgi:hypothetical protein
MQKRKGRQQELVVNLIASLAPKAVDVQKSIGSRPVTQWFS